MPEKEHSKDHSLPAGRYTWRFTQPYIYISYRALTKGDRGCSQRGDRGRSQRLIESLSEENCRSKCKLNLPVSFFQREETIFQNP